MKSIKLFFGITLLCIVLISSCTIEKRHYLSGYSVQWNHKKNNTHLNENKLPAIELPKQRVIIEKTLTASVEKKPIILKQPIKQPDLMPNLDYTKTKIDFKNNESIVIKKIVDTKIKTTKKAKGGGYNGSMVVLYILAFFIPPLAVGIFTRCGMPTLWNILWTLLFFFPGIIHAIIVLRRG